MTREEAKGNLIHAIRWNDMPKKEALEMAIKTLEQEPCEDAVNRQAVRDTIYAECSGTKLDIDFAKVLMLQRAIRSLPPATLQSKTGWIPVSERLPKIADVYRVTRYYPNNVMNPGYLVDACFFDGSSTWYNDNRINHERAYADNIIAWQENPEPYKVELQESE